MSMRGIGSSERSSALVWGNQLWTLKCRCMDHRVTAITCFWNLRRMRTVGICQGRPSPGRWVQQRRAVLPRESRRRMSRSVGSRAICQASGRWRTAAPTRQCSIWKGILFRMGGSHPVTSTNLPYLNSLARKQVCIDSDLAHEDLAGEHLVQVSDVSPYDHSIEYSERAPSVVFVAAS